MLNELHSNGHLDISFQWGEWDTQQISKQDDFGAMNKIKEDNIIHIIHDFVCVCVSVYTYVGGCCLEKASM